MKLVEKTKSVYLVINHKDQMFVTAENCTELKEVEDVLYSIVKSCKVRPSFVSFNLKTGKNFTVFFKGSPYKKEAGVSVYSDAGAELQIIIYDDIIVLELNNLGIRIVTEESIHERIKKELKRAKVGDVSDF